MRSWNLIFIISIFITSCGSNNSFSVSKIIDGNTVELSNGVTVALEGVSKSNDNLKILERYLKGNILLYDKNNEGITRFSSDYISATIYNSDGDCINQLLSRIKEISRDETPKIKDSNNNSDKTIVKFTHEEGVLKIPVSVNGVEMYFIFDTGASLISMSQAEAYDLYSQGKLKSDDFIGKRNFSDANGDISEGTIINLASVIIGNRELNNVQACILQGQNAPLLFGQSALQKFGKVSIDYVKSEITFE